MDAVLGIDLQSRPSVRIFDELINACRTIALLRPVVERQIDVNGYARIFSVK
jgi:hypothetical protein